MSFYGSHAGGWVLDVCTKFELDISIRSKVIRGSENFEIWSRDPGHAHFGVIRLDALALSVIGTATWLGGWVSQPVLYQND